MNAAQILEDYLNELGKAEVVVSDFKKGDYRIDFNGYGSYGDFLHSLVEKEIWFYPAVCCLCEDSAGDELRMLKEGMERLEQLFVFDEESLSWDHKKLQVRHKNKETVHIPGVHCMISVYINEQAGSYRRMKNFWDKLGHEVSEKRVAQVVLES